MTAYETGDRWLDPSVDGVTVYEPAEPEPGSVIPEGDDPHERVAVADPDLENLVVTFVECLTARDFEGVDELLAEAVEANLLSAHDRADAIAALEELVERHPSLVLTRGEMGEEPVAGAWVADSETGDYDLLGILRFGISDGADPLIERIDLVDPEGEDLLLEEPEPEEVAEWEDWRLTDEG